MIYDRQKCSQALAKKSRKLAEIGPAKYDLCLCKTPFIKPETLLGSRLHSSLFLGLFSHYFLGETCAIFIPITDVFEQLQWKVKSVMQKPNAR